MSSPDGVLVYGPGASVRDSAANVYTISAAGQLTINGKIDPPSAGVEALAYYDGAVYQKNDLNLWYSQTAPNYAVNGWTSYGTGARPVPFTASANDTVIAAGAGGDIIDSNANQWSITAGGEVGFDGVADALTANVIAIAYVDGLVWQENASGSWWAKTGGPGSYDGWSSGPGADNGNGTRVSPLPPGTPTWIGGGNNAASNPLDWSTDSTPKAGDTLIITAGTINISNSTLAGDVLNIPDGTPEQGSVTIDLNGGAAIGVADQSFYGDGLTINATGNDSIDFTSSTAIAASVDLAANASLVITGSMTFAYDASIVSGAGARIVNDGTLSLSDASIQGSLSGNGTLVLNQYHDGAGDTTIDGSVAAAQTVDLLTDDLGTGLTIDLPKTFHANVVISNQPASAGGEAQITLEGLTATSYEFKNGLLTLFSGNKVVDTLHLHNESSAGIAVQSPHSSPTQNVLVSFYTGVPAPGTEGTLPIHT